MNKSKLLVIEPEVRENELVLSNSRESGIPHFRILKRGGFEVIVNRTGEPVSEWYHEIESYEIHHDGLSIYILGGTLGATQRLLKPPTMPDEKFEASDFEFHHLTFREDLNGGMFTTSCGAMKYLIDPIEQRPFEKGYHQIWQEGKNIYGRLGAGRREVIMNLSSHSKQLEMGESPRKLMTDIKKRISFK